MYSLDLGRVETVAAVRKIMRPGAMFCPTPDGQQELPVQFRLPLRRRLGGTHGHLVGTGSLNGLHNQFTTPSCYS